jgi:hypothetical protein
MNKSSVHKTQDLKTLNPKNLNNCLENVRFQATGGKQKNMWPKSTEYVAKKHGICGQKAQICGQKAQDLGPKNAELSFNYL